MRKKDRWMLCKEEQELNTDSGSVSHIYRGRAGITMPFWDAHLGLTSGTCILPSGWETNPGYDSVALCG